MLLTADDVVRRAHYRNAQRTLYRLLDLGVVPVVNENDTVATEEIRFGDNDRLAALVAHLVHADLLVLLSDVPGVFEATRAGRGPGCSPRCPQPADLAGVRLGARRRDRHRHAAAWPPRSRRPGSRPPRAPGRSWRRSATSAAVLAGEPLGTSFTPAGRRLPDPAAVAGLRGDDRGVRCAWTRARSQAVVTRRMSLLPAGVTAVEGDFVAGDPVDLLDRKRSRRWPAGW